MTRKNFITIIRARSFWRIDHRSGDYFLPSGGRLSTYVTSLVRGQLDLDSLGIMPDGNLVFWDRVNDCLRIPWGENIPTTEEEQEERIEELVSEIVG